jgi:hypothetical protein
METNRKSPKTETPLAIRRRMARRLIALRSALDRQAAILHAIEHLLSAGGRQA